MVQMIPNTISDTFQAINDFSYGLDVEIRPKLTPGAGTPRWALAAIHPGWGNRYEISIESVWVVSSLFFSLWFYSRQNVDGKCSRQNVNSDGFPREYPQEGGRLDAKRY